MAPAACASRDIAAGCDGTPPHGPRPAHAPNTETTTIWYDADHQNQVGVFPAHPLGDSQHE